MRAGCHAQFSCEFTVGQTEVMKLCAKVLTYTDKFVRSAAIGQALQGGPTQVPEKLEEIASLARRPVHASCQRASRRSIARFTPAAQPRCAHNADGRPKPTTSQFRKEIAPGRRIRARVVQRARRERRHRRAGVPFRVKAPGKGIGNNRPAHSLAHPSRASKEFCDSADPSWQQRFLPRCISLIHGIR